MDISDPYILKQNFEVIFKQHFPQSKVKGTNDNTAPSTHHLFNKKLFCNFANMRNETSQILKLIIILLEKNGGGSDFKL